MNTRAFTLVELLVVLVFLGIVAGASAPMFAAIGQAGAGAGPSRSIVGLLKRARTTAVEEGGTITVLVDPERARYWVRVAESGELLDDGQFELPVGTTLRSARDRPMFTFYPTGPSFGDSLHVSTSDGVTLVTVDLWAGGPHAFR